MTTITPPPIRPGDTIAIVPTARAITVDELRDGIALAETWGLRVKLGAGIGRKHFQQAGSDAVLVPRTSMPVIFEHKQDPG